ncbi:MAG: acyl-CoA desaturase [Thermoplasmatota archaeon]
MSVDHTYPLLGKNLPNQLIVGFILIVPFVLTIYAMVSLWGPYFQMTHLVLMLSMFLFGGLGITVGYHRMLTHGAFKLRAPAKFLTLWMGITALQGGPASWAATHRRHHSLSDQEGDPHSPNVDGFFHAHIGWMLKGRMVQSGKGYDDLMEDKMVAFFERTQAFWYVFGFIFPAVISYFIGSGFWLGLLWGGFVRAFIMHHTTWSINSICHMWGARPLKAPDDSRNNVIFGVLGFGEGWHNNHHAFPKSAHLGLRWYQFDLGKYFLYVLRGLGMVKDVYVPSKEELSKRSWKVIRAAQSADEKAKAQKLST